MHVTRSEDRDAIETKPLNRVLQGGRDSLDDHHDRRGPRGGGTANLIFDQGSPGERKQAAKAAGIVS
jgi:hypothetical protein